MNRLKIEPTSTPGHSGHVSSALNTVMKRSSDIILFLFVFVVMFHPGSNSELKFRELVFDFSY